MDKTAKNNSNRFNPQKSMTGLFVALCQLRDANSERFNNGTCYIEISEFGDGYKASLHEYNEDIEKHMKTNCIKAGYADSGSGDEFIEKLYRDSTGIKNAVVYLLECYGSLYEYYIFRHRIMLAEM